MSALDDIHVNIRTWWPTLDDKVKRDLCLKWLKKYLYDTILEHSFDKLNHYFWPWFSMMKNCEWNDICVPAFILLYFNDSVNGGVGLYGHLKIFALIPLPCTVCLARDQHIVWKGDKGGSSGHGNKDDSLYIYINMFDACNINLET